MDKGRKVGGGEGGEELSRLPVQHQTGCCFTAAAVVDERAALRVSKAYSTAARAMRVFVHENARSRPRRVMMLVICSPSLRLQVGSDDASRYANA